MMPRYESKRFLPFPKFAASENEPQLESTLALLSTCQSCSTPNMVEYSPAKLDAAPHESIKKH